MAGIDFLSRRERCKHALPCVLLPNVEMTKICRRYRTPRRYSGNFAVNFIAGGVIRASFSLITRQIDLMQPCETVSGVHHQHDTPGYFH